MNTGIFEANKVVAMSVAVLVTGLLLSGISGVADSQYQRAEKLAQQVATQQVAVTTTRSGMFFA